MSFDPDSVEHEMSVIDLLKQIVNRLDILIRHNENITDEIFTEEDVDT